MHFYKIGIALIALAHGALAANGVGTSCSYQGLSGTCKYTSDCNGFRVKGLCPGPADVQCCLPKNSCSYDGESGKCLPTGQCGGRRVTGRCPGGKDIQCCLSGNGGSSSSSSSSSSNGVGASCSYQGLSGTCKYTSDCNGFRVKGLCPGPADVQCCLPKYSCTYGDESGKCLPTGQCDGHRVTGRCPGGKDIQCCLSGIGGSSGSSSGSSSGGGCVDHSTISSAAVAIAWETKSLGNGNWDRNIWKIFIDDIKTWIFTILSFVSNRRVKDAIFPGDPYYQSCDRGVATSVRWSGADDRFPVGNTR